MYSNEFLSPWNLARQIEIVGYSREVKFVLLYKFCLKSLPQIKIIKEVWVVLSICCSYNVACFNRFLGLWFIMLNTPKGSCPKSHPSSRRTTDTSG